MEGQNCMKPGKHSEDCQERLSLVKKESLKDFKIRMRKSVEKLVPNKTLLKDDYSNAMSTIDTIRKPTGIVLDDDMALHSCPWDLSYPENPDRYYAVVTRCDELGLIERCQRLNYDSATIEEINLCHKSSLYKRLENICTQDDNVVLEKEASKYDAIYFNKDTLRCARIAAGCCISLVKEICKGSVQNGFAIVRPPGHHAMHDEFCGYCYFNNVSVTARYALQNCLAKKILIVDFDVHHGQGTQRLFYEDNSVLYFSIHRYEDGLFWPNLRESNFDYVGAAGGTGYNINVPLNCVKLGDNDYLAIVQQILVPVAYEFQPDLIVISAGFDSTVGDEKGLMNVTPGFYGHLIKSLSGLASGKVAVCLEGGYFLPSLAEGAAMTLKSLLGDPPATLLPTDSPNDAVISVINSLKFMLHKYWNCFGWLPLHASLESPTNNIDCEDLHHIEIKYLGRQLEPPYETRDCYPVRSVADSLRFTNIITKLQHDYNKLKATASVAYVYDEEMLLHSSKNKHPERPDRLKKVYDTFVKFQLDKRCLSVPSRSANESHFKLIHQEEYVNKLVTDDLGAVCGKNSDLYHNKHTIKSICKSTGSLLSVVDSVLKGEANCGVGLIRPPGHHAEKDTARGFCFINNVSVAAKYILDRYKMNRILILDFDVHHGNGTQHIFYDTNDVLFVSLHRYDNALFYPSCEDANYDFVGTGKGEGYNINIPFNDVLMGDAEYMAVFFNIVLPIIYSYAPEVILVSAGFDAGINDPLGNYKVQPETFAHLVQQLKPLAGGKIILCLEGGYNLETLSVSMAMCVKALLGDPLPHVTLHSVINESCRKTIENVIQVQKKYWNSLLVHKKLPQTVKSLEYVDKDGNVCIIQQPTNEMLSCDLGIDQKLPDIKCLSV